MVAPVWGLRPSRAERLETEKDPNPTKETRPSLARVLATLPVNESNAFFAWAFEMPASAAIASMISALFIEVELGLLFNHDSYKYS